MPGRRKKRVELRIAALGLDSRSRQTSDLTSERAQARPRAVYMQRAVGEKEKCDSAVEMSMVLEG